MDDIRDDDNLISIDDFDFQPIAEECPECGAPTSEWVETRDYLSWHCPRCGNDFPIDEVYNEPEEFHDSTYDLDMTDDEWNALEDEDLDMLEEIIRSARKDLPNLAPPESKSKQPEGEVDTYHNPPHHVSNLRTSDFGRKGIKEGFFDKRIEVLDEAEHCDNQEELDAELAKHLKIEGEHEDGYKSPVRESIDDGSELSTLISEYSEFSDEIEEVFDYCVRLFDALRAGGIEDISSGDLDSMIRDGQFSGAIEDDYDDTLGTDRENIVYIFDQFEDQLGEDEAQELVERIEDAACSAERPESFAEDTKKVKGGYQNVGKKGKHSKKPMTKKAADDQRKAMFANGYHEGVGTSKVQVSDSIATLIDMFMPEVADDMKAQIANGNTDALHVALRQIDRGINKNLAGKIPENVIREYKAFRESYMSNLDVERQEAEENGEDWEDPMVDERFICFDCDAEGSANELDEFEGQPACPNCGSTNVDTYHEEDLGDELDDEAEGEHRRPL
jgi:Zn finger protein HypA/HybF involved in hydrogenase expression